MTTIEAQEKAMTMDSHLRAHRDPLSGFFRWGRRLFPIANSHVCIVEGELDPNRLRHALQTTLGRFDHLHDLLTADEGIRRTHLSGNALTVISSEHPLDFDSTGFRENLMAQVARHNGVNRDYEPVHLLLVHSADRRRSCLHLSITHDVADVKSGNIFLVELMREYAGTTGETAPESATEREQGPRFEHLPLERLRPDWFAGWAPFVRWARANLEITRRMATRARTQISLPASGTNPSPPEGDVDFRHIVLPQQLREELPLAARRYNVTINTFFSAALVRYIGRYQRRRHPLAVYTIAISLRKLIGAAYAETFRSYMIDCTLRVPHELEDQKLFSRIEAQTAAARQDDLEVELGRMESAITLFKSPLPRALVLWIMKRTQGTNILYSNPGVVEEDFSTVGPGGPSISAMTIFSCLVPPYDLVIHTPTIGGRLQLDLVYRRSSFSDIDGQFVKPFLWELEQLVDARGNERQTRDSSVVNS
jgi:hypothetical protein